VPEAARADYVEAQAIVGHSPRGVCALLRLALQKLCVELDESGENLNADIASLGTLVAEAQERPCSRLGDVAEVALLTAFEGFCPEALAEAEALAG
jgi:hypothetical protein